MAKADPGADGRYISEHEKKRRRNLIRCSLQINPHFLSINTLDIIVGMIESEKPDQAVKRSLLWRVFFGSTVPRKEHYYSEMNWNM